MECIFYSIHSSEGKVAVGNAEMLATRYLRKDLSACSIGLDVGLLVSSLWDEC